MRKNWIGKLFVAECVAAMLLTGCGDIYVTQKPDTAQSGAGQVGSYSASGQTSESSSEGTIAGQGGSSGREGALTGQTGQQNATTLLPENAGTSSQMPVVTGEITEDQARQIALTDAGISEDQIQRIHIKRDKDDNRWVWDVEFIAQSAEYDYEIAVADGTILSKDYDTEHVYEGFAGSQSGTGSQSSAGGTNSGSVTSGISAEDAQAIVAGKIPGVDASSVYVKTDYDDGYWLYEGKVYNNNMEYEFEIDANTGKVLKWEVESIYD